jgi:hypothetical protein
MNPQEVGRGVKQFFEKLGSGGSTLPPPLLETIKDYALGALSRSSSTSSDVNDQPKAPAFCLA